MNPVPATILVIDDDHFHLQVVIQFLEDTGFKVLACQDGCSGITTARQSRPDLILLDIMMPEMDGFEICRRLQSYKSTQSIPIIFMTALTETEHKIAGFEAGGVDYITKPLEFEEMLARIITQIDLRRLQLHLKKTYNEMEERVIRRTAELQKTNEALMKSEERYRTLIDTAGEGIIIVDNDASLSFVNRQMAAMLAYSVDEMIGRPLTAFLDAQNAALLKKKLKKRRQGHSEQYDLCFCRKDGSHMWGIVNGTPLFGPNGQVTGSFGMITDVTKRKHAEADLQQSRERYQAVVEDAPAMICRFKADGSITFANNMFCTTWCQTERTLIGRNFFELTGNNESETTRNRFGSLSRENHLSIYEQQTTGTDGQTRWYEWTDRALFDKRGRITEYQSIGRDITEVKLAREQRESMQMQLRQAQRLESIGTLASGIAHDFNNILGAIIGYSELLSEDNQDNEHNLRRLEKVLQSAYRARDLVRQILSFCRKTDRQRHPVSMAPLIKEALKLLRATLPATIEIRSYIKADTDRVLADPSRLHQLIINLCTNAKQAMDPTGGTLEVSLTQTVLATATVVGHLMLSAGPYLKLSVSDTGQGMTADILEKIFDPYFTTKPQGEGTGLGLSIVHGIVKEYDGGVQVSSEPGHGTVFNVFLPVSQACALQESMPLKSTYKGNGRILLVDDEENLVGVCGEMLSSLGYQVTGKTSSPEALDIFRSCPHGFDVVVTDYNMPHMNGIQLAEALIGIRNDIPIVLCTGYIDNMTPAAIKRKGIKEMVFKPLRKSEISNVLHHVLQ